MAHADSPETFQDSFRVTRRDTDLFRWSIEILLFTFTYASFAKGGMILTAQGFGTPFWPASGLALFALLTFGLRLWPGVFLGYVLANLNVPISLFFQVAMGAAATFEAMLTTYLLRLLFGDRFDFTRTRTVFYFIAVGAVLSPAISMAISAYCLYAGGALSSDALVLAWRTMAIGDGLGVLLVTPLLVALKRIKSVAIRDRDLTEFVVMFSVTTLICIYVFHSRLPLAFVIFPCIFWAGLRFQVVGVCAVALAVTLIGAHYTSIDFGPFAAADDVNRLALFQVFSGVLVSSGLFLSTVAQTEVRHRALLRVSAERRRFQAAAECASDLIYEWDIELQTIHWWGKIDEVLGYQVGKFPRTYSGWTEIIHPEDKDRVSKAIRASLATGREFHEEYRIVRSDGSVGYWKDVGQLIQQETPGANSLRKTLWVGAVTDVTESKLNEEALRKSEERYHLATEAAGIGVWDWNASDDTTRWSPTVARLFGTDRLELKSNDVFALILEEDRKMVEENFRRGFEEQRLNFAFTFRVHQADGAVHWLQGKGRLKYTEDGTPIGARGTTIDITETKRFEEALNRAKEEAEAASQAKMQFLANMSHEIRTPMNAILGFADLLSSGESPPEQRHDFAERIQANGEQLLALINDILDLSKFEAGRVPVEKLNFSFIELISQIMRMLGPLAEKKTLSLKCEFSSPVPQVITSDPVRLRQILTNLIGNSLKFTETGGITIKVSFLQQSESPLGKSPARLCVAVEDTGIGITPQAQRKLFRPFSQGDSSVTRRFGGTGLGLVLSKRIAQALGGDLHLTRSEPGKGSCFSFEIDPGDVTHTLFVNGFEEVEALRQAGKRAQQSERPKTEEKHDSLSGLTILLAEDSPDNEALVKLYLSMEGAKVCVAHNGVEALQMASAHDSNFDLVLMDVQMPFMDGLEATRRLRSEHEFKKPIIALTAHALREEINRSLSAGCNAHLTKPINRGKLIDAILESTGRIAKAVPDLVP